MKGNQQEEEKAKQSSQAPAIRWRKFAASANRDYKRYAQPIYTGIPCQRKRIRSMMMMMMKISTTAIALALLAAAKISHAVDVSDVDVDSSMYKILVDAERAGIPHHHPGKTKGQIALQPSFVRKIKAAAADTFINNGIFSATGGSIIAPMTSMTQTSKAHVDTTLQYENRPGVPPDDKVGFVFLTTNDDAHFDVDDTCIPARKNRLVTFDGAKSIHQTIIKRGRVNLLGPFHIKTFVGVGEAPCASYGGVCCPGGCDDNNKVWGANDCGATCCRRCGNDCANAAGTCCQSPCPGPSLLISPAVSGCTTSEECCMGLPTPGGTCTLQLSCSDDLGGTCCSADSCPLPLPLPSGISTDCDDAGQSCCLSGIGGQACGSECEVLRGGTCCSEFCSSDTIDVPGATLCPAGESCCNTATGGKCKSCARECETDEGETGCSYVMPIGPPQHAQAKRRGGPRRLDDGCVHQCKSIPGPVPYYPPEFQQGQGRGGKTLTMYDGSSVCKNELPPAACHNHHGDPLCGQGELSHCQICEGPPGPIGPIGPTRGIDIDIGPMYTFCIDEDTTCCELMYTPNECPGPDAMDDEPFDGSNYANPNEGCFFCGGVCMTGVCCEPIGNEGLCNSLENCYWNRSCPGGPKCLASTMTCGFTYQVSF